MTSAPRRPGRDRLFREVFADGPVRAAEVCEPAPPPLSLALRRFPFPFAAGLAISNDCRTMSAETFAEVYRAFAERGLEVGVGLSFAPGDICSAGSAHLAPFAEAGLVDSLFGLPPGGGSAAAEVFDGAGVRPACYIGDPSIAEAAPLAEAGVRYFTDCGLVVGEKFGDGLDLRTTARLREVFGRFSFDELGDQHSAGGTDLGALWEALPAGERRRFAAQLFNAPLLTLPTAHGPVSAFKRYRGPQRPAATTLADQLRSLFLDGLELTGGMVIIEQNLGETALLGQAPGDEQRRTFANDVVGTHERVALDELAARSGDQLLVALPSRLLHWAELRQSLRFEVDETEDLWLIRLTGWNDAGTVPRERLDGLAFTLPASAPRTLVLIEGEERELPMTRAREPKLSDHDCLYLPWETRPCPKF